MSKSVEEKKQKELENLLGGISTKQMNQKWKDCTFNGQPTIEIPDFFMDSFKKAVMDTPANVHQIMSLQIVLISGTEVKDLAFGQVGMALAVFSFARPASWEPDYDTWIQKRKQLDRVLIMHTGMYKLMQDELIAARKKFSAENGGSRIITGSQFHK